MNTSNRNERKIEILNILKYATSPLSAIEIHEQCYPITLSITAISSRLLSYVRQRIIKKKKVNKKYIKPFRYEITPLGEKRLNYLINLKEEQDELLVREPVRFLKS